MMAFWPDKALDAVAEYKNVSLAARRVLSRNFFFVYFCPRIFKPNVPNILRILTACPFDPVLHFHRVLIGTAQESVMCTAGRATARMLMIVGSFEGI